MPLACENVKADDVELLFVMGHLDYALNVLWAYHAEILPHHLSVHVDGMRSVDRKRRSLGEQSENSWVSVINRSWRPSCRFFL